MASYEKGLWFDHVFGGSGYDPYALSSDEDCHDYVDSYLPDWWL